MTNPKADPLREAQQHLTELFEKAPWMLNNVNADSSIGGCHPLTYGDLVALVSQPAAAPVGGREEIAAFLLARDEADTNVPVPHGLILWAHNLLTNGKDAAHSGDCTNECHSCVRCTADRALRDADAILAAAGRAALQKDAGK